MRVAIDFGLSNLKLVYSSDRGDVPRTRCRPALRHVDVDAVRSVLAEDGHDVVDFEAIAVTGGHSAALPSEVEGVPIDRVSEVESIGRGGLLAAGGLDVALVVSSGSGTAAIAARSAGSDGFDVRHVSGTAVGGGTLCGLGRLLVGTDDAEAIDALAQRGDAGVLDLTLRDVVHGPIGSLPPDATAVNFGRAAEIADRGAALPVDMAASLVTMIAQTVALIAIGAARSERCGPIVLIGRVPSLPSVAAQLQRTARFYGVEFIIPAEGVYAPARGALAASFSRRDRR